jgi:hypothetical protein
LAFWSVQDKIRIWITIRQVTPIGKQVRAQPGFIGHFKKAGRNDLVSVNIIDQQYN